MSRSPAIRYLTAPHRQLPDNVMADGMEGPLIDPGLTSQWPRVFCAPLDGAYRENFELDVYMTR
jgi:hypothetical protein